MRRRLHLLLSVVLVLPVASAVAVQGASPAAAAECPSSGGATMPTASAGGDVVFRGGGWGHGLGMSQYGAQGAARLGCTYDQILTRYYSGSEVRPATMPDLVRLRMLSGGHRVDVAAHDGPLTWALEGCVGPTAADPDAAPCPPVQPQGSTWGLRLDDVTRSQFVLYDLGVLPQRVVWQGGSPAQVLRLDQAGTVAHVTTWKGRSVHLDRWLRWDRTRFALTEEGIDAVQYIETTGAGSAMDKYLWGVAEVPASFPLEALKAQAVAARTYAAKRAGRVLQPTPTDQNWTGWKKETEGVDGVWGARWRSAVDATSGTVVAMADGGPLVDAFYSSSMGGHTEDERYVWGVEAPFLRAVDDSRWDLASGNPAEKRSWAKGFSWATLAKRLGFATVRSISVPQRGDPARSAGVTVTGVRDGTLTTTYLEGWDVRQALGLPSPGFTVSSGTVGGKAAQPLTGDWDGDGADEPGWFRAGAVALAMSGGGSSWTKRFRYGQAGDVAVVGDWDRDGDDDLGVFRDGTWLLRTGLTAGGPSTTFAFGAPGDRPVVGSWNGRTTGVGVVRGNRWMLRHRATAGPSQRSFRYGRPGDVAVVGSWNGSGRTAVGVERDGTWLLRNRRSAGKAGVRLAFGRDSDRALAGDWDGDGRSTVGVVRRTTFRMLATLADASSAVPRRVFVG